MVSTSLVRSTVRHGFLADSALQLLRMQCRTYAIRTVLTYRTTVTYLPSRVPGTLRHGTVDVPAFTYREVVLC